MGSTKSASSESWFAPYFVTATTQAPRSLAARASSSISVVLPGVGKEYRHVAGLGGRDIGELYVQVGTKNRVHINTQQLVVEVVGHKAGCSHAKEPHRVSRRDFAATSSMTDAS